MSGLEVSVAGRNGKFAVEADFAARWGVTALFGHSGAGKTTLLKMIAGTLRPESGRIAVGDFTLFDAERVSTCHLKNAVSAMCFRKRGCFRI